MRITKANVRYDNNRKLQLVKEMSVNYNMIDRLSSADTIANVMTKLFDLGNATEEHVYLIGLNNTLKCRAIFEISKGTENQSLVSERIIFRNLLLCDANNFVLVHNHPSGEVVPSLQDKNVTKKLKQCADLLQIYFCDHIIIGTAGRWYSFQEHGYL